MAKKKLKQAKRRNQRHYNKGYKMIAFVVVLIFLVIIVTKSVSNNEEQINYEDTQIIIDNENITSKLKDGIIIENNKVYMSYNDIQECIDKDIYIEDETDLIITASNKKIATISHSEGKITINGVNQKVDNILIEEQDKVYIAISELKNVYDYDLEYIENSNVVTIDSLSKKHIKVYAKKNIEIKEDRKFASKVIGSVQKGKWLIYIDEENGMAKVRTQDGRIGYVKRKLLDNFVTEREELIENKNEKIPDEKIQEIDITGKDISNYKKRLEVINYILQEVIKNDKISVKIIYRGDDESKLNRFYIEATPMLRECGIRIEK